MRSKPALELSGIYKSYEQKPLLEDISFKLHARETICLLGASGSGKSTLLKMVAGLDFPEAGQILFNGMDLAQTPPHLRDFGLVFQDYGLFPHLDVFNNIAFGLKMRNLPAQKIQERVHELLQLVNLQGFESRKTADLSGGEQQRVALARALAPNPRLLMFDEPLGALDRTLKEDLLNNLRAILKRMKIPAIYVTHDQEEAFAIADRILLLHNGRIAQDDTPANIWNHPRSAWAAEFLGAGNVIEGIVSGKKVKTKYGWFTLYCKHKHIDGAQIKLLVRQSDKGDDRITAAVEDILFKQDQFQVKLRGGFSFHTKESFKIGQQVKIRVSVEHVE